MQDLSEAQTKFIAELEAAVSRRTTEIEQINLILDAERLNAFGESLSKEALAESTAELMTSKTEIEKEIRLISSYILMVQAMLLP
jgi:uncharacterized membrane protein YqiK